MHHRCQAFELTASEPPPPRGTSNSERAQAVKGGKGEAAVHRTPAFTLCSPRLRPPVHHRCQAFGPCHPGLVYRCTVAATQPPLTSADRGRTGTERRGQTSHWGHNISYATAAVSSAPPDPPPEAPPSRACIGDHLNPPPGTAVRAHDTGRVAPWDSREFPHFNHVTARPASSARQALALRGGAAPPKHLKLRVGTDGEGRKRGGQQCAIDCTHTLLPPSPPACAPPLSGALSVCGSDTSMSVCAQTNNKDMGGRGYFPPGLRVGSWRGYLFVTPRRAST